MSDFMEGGEPIQRRLLVTAAKKAMQKQGYVLSKVPGRGLSNIWKITKNGETKIACIRTTRDRWIAFPPLQSGLNWKTLDDVDSVVVATVDSKEEPENIEVYFFPAADVRNRFDAAYSARRNDGQTVKDNFGMWVSLDYDDRGIAASVGSGLVDHFERVAQFSISTLIEDTSLPTTQVVSIEAKAEARIDSAPSSIAEVVAWTRGRVARIAGVPLHAVRLDLKIEY